MCMNPWVPAWSGCNKRNFQNWCDQTPHSSSAVGPAASGGNHMFIGPGRPFPSSIPSGGFSFAFHPTFKEVKPALEWTETNNKQTTNQGLFRFVWKSWRKQLVVQKCLKHNPCWRLPASYPKIFKTCYPVVRYDSPRFGGSKGSYPPIRDPMLVHHPSGKNVETFASKRGNGDSLHFIHKSLYFH